MQLVNKVLVNLREAQVTDLSSTYAQLVGEFINQAKEKVEDAWRWKALSSTFLFTSIASQITYPITAAASSPAVSSSSGNYPTGREEILTDEEGNEQTFDVTTATTGTLIRLQRVTRENEYALNTYLATQSAIQPNFFSYQSNTSGGIFTFVQAPQGGRIINMHMKIPQDEFSLGTEIILVPWRPVVSWATFLAMEERGEELSEKSSLYMDRHNQELQRSIEQDTMGEKAYDQLRNN